MTVVVVRPETVAVAVFVTLTFLVELSVVVTLAVRVLCQVWMLVVTAVE